MRKLLVPVYHITRNVFDCGQDLKTKTIYEGINYVRRFGDP